MRIEVMQQALEALEAVHPYTDSLICYASTIEQHPPNAIDDKVGTAITALRAALAEPEQTFMAEYKHRVYGYYQDADGKMQLGEIPQRTEPDEKPITSVTEAVTTTIIEVEKLLCEKLGKTWKPSGMSIQTLVDELAAQRTEPEQEPVGVVDEVRDNGEFHVEFNRSLPIGTRLYTEFVCSTGLCRYRRPLTDEEIVSIELRLRKYVDGDRYDLSLSDFARAIEARHGIGYIEHPQGFRVNPVTGDFGIGTPGKGEKK